MKRPRSYEEDPDLDRYFSHRRFHLKSDLGRKGSHDDDREMPRPSRKRSDHESDAFDWRKCYDRFRDSSDRPSSVSSPRGVYGGIERIRRSESLSGLRREFDGGSRSERDRLRREECVSAWRRSVIGKGLDEDTRNCGEWGSQDGSEDKAACVRSPLGSREIGSKDSGSERSRSMEVRKIASEACGESGGGGSGSSSEMEEGELEPETQPDLGRESEANSVPVDVAEPATVNRSRGLEEGFEKDIKPLDEEKEAIHEKGSCDETHEIEVQNGGEDPLPNNVVNPEEENAIIKLGGSNSPRGTAESEEREEDAEEESELLPSSDDEKTESERGSEEQDLDIGNEDRKHIDLVAEVGDSSQSDKDVRMANGLPSVTLAPITDKFSDNYKDKGKSVVVCPSSEGNLSDGQRWIEIDLLAPRESDVAGTSCRSFELFFDSNVKRVEKTNKLVANVDEDRKLAMEPLELSLGLPSFNSVQDCHDQKQVPKCKGSVPNSPSRGMSMQSLPTTFFTGSDGFTASLSFSASEGFVHNPSCSLTQNSLENYKHSVGSHPVFQGVDQVAQGGSWQGQSLVDSKRKEVPLFQKILQNGNGSARTSGAPQDYLNGYSFGSHQYINFSGSSNGIANILDHQLSRPGESSRQFRHDEVQSSRSLSSQETRSEHSMDKKVVRNHNGGGIFCARWNEMEPLIHDSSVATSVVARIVSEPVQIMNRTVQEMKEQSIAFLKGRVSEIIDKEENQGQLSAFQELLSRRDDLNLETLTNCHRVQLEILVALKTGLRSVLWRAENVPSSDLVEIFLNLKCQNIACRSILPVDECDCKVCVAKSGFCSACMCLVCSKFDMVSNTCSWVGCDVCLHWCHTDCALRNSHIRNGRSVSETQGTTEMQFHCVACDHPSEMFGFVKEVFETCSKDWNAKNFSKELEYVKRIFSASGDVRGKQMHDVATQMLEKLENGSNLKEVYNSIMTFLSGDCKFGNNPSTSLANDIVCKMGDGNGLIAPSRDTRWLRTLSAEKASPSGNSGARHSTFDWERVGCRTGLTDLQFNAEKKPVVDELESIVRIKEAEAKMFQTRADDARRDGESLKRIAIAKNEKIEEDYANQIAKLQLVEAEEKRKQKLEELHAVEKAYQDYYNMKMRMEADIKNLLLKVEATKRNLTV